MDYRELLAKLVEQRERAHKLLVQHDIGLADMRDTMTRGQTSRDGLARLLEALDEDIAKIAAKLVPAQQGTSS